MSLSIVEVTSDATADISMLSFWKMTSWLTVTKTSFRKAVVRRKVTDFIFCSSPLTSGQSLGAASESNVVCNAGCEANMASTAAPNDNHLKLAGFLSDRVLMLSSVSMSS